jgi:hypothetical protein
MENYPSNSNKAKPAGEAKAEPKKIESVVTGEVTRRKTPLGKRFAETFIGGDARSVGGYVLLDVLVPAARDMIADAFTQGIERMIYGEVKSASRRGGSRPSGPNGYVSYNRIAQSNNRPRSGLEEFGRREPSRKARGTHDFDDIIIATRHEAEEVVRRLYDIIESYEVATVSDLYELVGITSNYTDNKWGWTELPGAGVVRVRDGYLLELPKPQSVEE